MNRLKIFLSIAVGAAVLGACDSGSSGPSQQIFTVLNQQNAIVFKDGGVSASTMDPGQTAGGKGGVIVNGYVPTISGGVLNWVNKEVSFEQSEMSGETANAMVFSKIEQGSEVSSGSVLDYTTTSVLTLGGVKTGLKYGDFGYWAETIAVDIRGNLETQMTKDFWATMLIYDPAYRASMIPEDPSTYAFSGNVLGGVDLYNDQNEVEETSAISGSITLNANFRDKTVDAQMDLNIGTDKWYTVNYMGNSGIGADGQVQDNDSLTLTGYDDNQKYSAPGTGNMSSYFQGQFMGEAGYVPEEVLGHFDIHFDALNKMGYRPDIYGVFGAKR
ncbi:hypothetical protein AAIR98_001908 [Elusimicrobium simillimum]|uniref:hypothetical protein n=1 Tax=Elusimicrobium simillimum TaxID=3143438 RepID=UPI003C6FDF43